MLPLRYARVFILLFLAFLFAQMYAGLGVGVVETSDSPVFASMARDHPVFSKAFLAGPRPPLTSLVMKAVAGSISVRIWGLRLESRYSQLGSGLRGLRCRAYSWV